MVVQRINRIVFPDETWDLPTPRTDIDLKYTVLSYMLSVIPLSRLL